MHRERITPYQRGPEQRAPSHAGVLCEQARASGEARTRAHQPEAAGGGKLPRIRARHVIAKRRHAHGEVAGAERRPGAHRERMGLHERRPSSKRALRDADAALHAGALAARVGGRVIGDDVDDATDSIRPIERRALRAANHFDMVHRLRRELRDEQRVRDLDSIDVDLRVAHAERARPANASISGEQAGRRLFPHPEAGH